MVPRLSGGCQGLAPARTLPDPVWAGPEETDTAGNAEGLVSVGGWLAIPGSHIPLSPLLLFFLPNPSVCLAAGITNEPSQAAPAAAAEIQGVENTELMWPGPGTCVSATEPRHTGHGRVTASAMCPSGAWCPRARPFPPAPLTGQPGETQLPHRGP